jgi:hypothetical protein
VKESSGNIRPWGDGRAKQIWKKPVGVLVDRYSLYLKNFTICYEEFKIYS